MARKSKRGGSKKLSSYTREVSSYASKALSGIGTAQVIAILPWVAGGIAVWWAYTKLAGGEAGFNLTEPGYIPVPTGLPRPEYVYADIADREFNAMNMYGTDTESLFSAVEGLTPAELVAVASKFGKRASTISLFPGTQQSISFPRTLTEWYDSELSGSDRDRMKAIWAGTGLY
jgi:hypothetical protein